MSRRRRSAREKAVRSRVTREKELRRRTRRSGARRTATAATAATAAAVTLAAGGAPVALSVEATTASAGASMAACTNPTPPSNPDDMVEVGEKVFFTADDGIHGHELWVSDGSPTGTFMVRNIVPSSADDEEESYGDPNDLVAVGDTLFFAVDDGVHGRELWKSNGTRSGTVLVKDIDTKGGYYAEGPAYLTAVGDTLFFAADDGIHGHELWTSNGTPTGTVMVKDIDKNDDRDDDDEYYIGPSSLTEMNGKLYFSAEDEGRGEELWTSDGTPGGTVLVKDIHPGDYDSEPENLAGVDGTLYFTARDGEHGRELWKSDGIPGGSTVLVRDIRPGIGTSDPSAVVGAGGKVFLTADDGTHGPELWTTNGTEAGTVLVKDIDPNPDYGYGDYRGSSMIGFEGSVFFATDDGSHGRELWASDGTPVGTEMVKDLRPGAYGSDPGFLAVAGGTLFFTARDGAHGPEVWSTDGTSGNTVLVEDIHPGVRHYQPTYLTDVDGKLYFSADDGVRGAELWTSDPAGAGADLVKDINLGGAFAVASKGTANTRTGTMAVRVRVEGAGTLAVKAARRTQLRSSTQNVASAGRTTVTLKPTRAGMRTLRRDGRLRVKARFTFTPCGGTGTSVVKPYTLRLR